MKFSVATADITPIGPVWLAGFGDRTHKSEGVHDPVHMKIVLLQANKTLLIVTLDAVGADRSFIVGVKDALEQAFGLAHEDVLINFSHTHASVKLTGSDYAQRDTLYSMADGVDFNRTAGALPEDEAYYAFVRDTLVRLTADGLANLTDGELLLGRGTSRFSVSRRKPTAAGIKWAPYPEGEYDDELIVLKLVGKNGELRALLYNYACHPTSMGPDNYLVSGDFAGATSRMLEENYPGTTALFLQGCCAELKPVKSAADGAFKNCSYAEMEEAGADLARDVVRVAEENAFAPVRCSFRTILVDPLLYTEQTEASFYERLADSPDTGEYRRKSAVRTLRKIKDGTVKDRAPLYISVWHLDEETRLIALEGEIATAYSLLLKRMFPGGRTIVLGYTNGNYYYVPTRQMIAEGGYEADANYCFGSFRGTFVPEVEDIVVGQIVKADLRLRMQEPIA
ncbi:neutral/alkaline non-lysosomal ceramidase N-terminal domain-containing protein [Cohnella sp. GCM10012308]|uniref:neutral/alkaline non-lysosomal ceramidase N-terminal domain-containing protein n=1 Tax=Cohnella sp. GCM10012308 TaxID=3317329 RepID=UPI003609C81B